MALMHFHIARVNSKVDAGGFNIPINLQDRRLWSDKYIDSANQFLSFALLLEPGASSRFLIEAKIAREHCLADSFAQTNWINIERLYAKLVSLTNSPVAGLNHAIAMSYAGNIQKGIVLVHSIMDQKPLKKSYLPVAVLSHLNALAGNTDLAFTLASEAKDLGGTPHEHQLMMLQLERLTDKKLHI